MNLLPIQRSVIYDHGLHDLVPLVLCSKTGCAAFKSVHTRTFI